MALGDPYITTNELKTYLRSGAESGNKIAPDVVNARLDPLMEDAIASASNEIELYCGRQFNKTTEASARVYTAVSPTMCFVDDFHTTTDLVVEIDEDEDGVFETELTLGTDYVLEPVNGVVNGRTGRPYCRIAIRRYSSWYFPCGPQTVRVTAQWGWDEIPAAIKQATFLISHDTLKAKDNPFGIAGFSEFGVMRVRNNLLVESKLRPFRRGGLDVG